jgi:hypothetical protein
VFQKNYDAMAQLIKSANILLGKHGVQKEVFQLNKTKIYGDMEIDNI